MNLIDRCTQRLFIHPLRSERDLESHLHRPTPKRRQIQKLRLLGMDDLQQDHIAGIRKLQVEIVELRDVRCIYPGYSALVSIR